MSYGDFLVKRKLRVGETILRTIESHLKWNDTAVEVSPGERYSFSATGSWFDANTRTGPAGYVSERWLFRITERFRRMPNENWFCLIGSVGKTTASAFHVGRQSSATVSSAGTLVFFANDLPLFYWNNSGSISLEIRRDA